MVCSRRTVCAVGLTALAALPLCSMKTPGGERSLLALASRITDRAAVLRLARLFAGALGAAEAAALVHEQELRVLREAPQMFRSSIAALIGADFRAGRTIDVEGLRVSRLEGAILIAGVMDRLPTSDFT